MTYKSSWFIFSKNNYFYVILLLYNLQCYKQSYIKTKLLNCWRVHLVIYKGLLKFKSQKKYAVFFLPSLNLVPSGGVTSGLKTVTLLWDYYCWNKFSIFFYQYFNYLLSVLLIRFLMYWVSQKAKKFINVSVNKCKIKIADTW